MARARAGEVDILIVPDILQFVMLRAGLESLDGILSPLLAAIAIKMTSPGPIFYRQERPSLDGTLSEMFKFRSMRVDEASMNTAGCRSRLEAPAHRSYGRPSSLAP